MKRSEWFLRAWSQLRDQLAFVYVLLLTVLFFCVARYSNFDPEATEPSQCKNPVMLACIFLFDWFQTGFNLQTTTQSMSNSEVLKLGATSQRHIQLKLQIESPI